MEFELPSALAGDDNDVSMDEDGLKRVAKLIGGTVVGAGILAVGGMLFNWARQRVGVNQQIGDLY